MWLKLGAQRLPYRFALRAGHSRGGDPHLDGADWRRGGGGVSPMLPGDLADEGKAEAGPSRARSTRAIERRENPLAFSRGDAVPAIAHRQQGIAALGMDADL